MQVNVSNKMRQNALDLFAQQGAAENVFNECQAEVFKLMELNILELILQKNL